MFSVEKDLDPNLNPPQIISITTKDGRSFKFFLPYATKDKDKAAETIYKVIDTFAFPEDDKHVFAFSHLPKGNDEEHNSNEVEGWTVFTDLSDYERMGIDHENKVVSYYVIDV